MVMICFWIAVASVVVCFAVYGIIELILNHRETMARIKYGLEEEE